jgi:hypothetical protein
VSQSDQTTPMIESFLDEKESLKKAA